MFSKLITSRNINKGFLSTTSINFMRSFSSSPYFDPKEIDKEYEVVIESLANNGMGVARIPYLIPTSSSSPSTSLSSSIKQWVVMIPYTVPGEKILIKIAKNNRNYSEGKLLKVLSEPNTESSQSNPSLISQYNVRLKTPPPCPFFTKCNGCSYQHLSIDSQRFWKQEQIKNDMKKIGKFCKDYIDLVQFPIGNEEIYHYRKKLTPNIEINNEDNQKVSIGFYQQDPYNLIDIPYCHLATENINKKYQEERNKIINTSLSSTSTLSSSLLFRESYDKKIYTKENEELYEKIHNINFNFKAGDFFQVNPKVAEKIVKFVIDNTNNEKNLIMENLLDMYCGSGLFSLTLSSYFKNIYSIEISSKAIENLNKNCINNNISNIISYCISDKNVFKNNKLKKILSNLNKKSTCVIINPPRNGCDDYFLKELKQLQFQKIIYVSCNPSTQIRDAKKLTHNEENINDNYNNKKNNKKQLPINNYSITKIQPFDMFPQTKHIENVMIFELQD